MPQVKTEQPCVICGKRESVMHSHHTTPQSRGGVDSPQVILDPNCHNLVHAHALWLYTQLRKPRKNREQKTFWASSELEERAAPLVKCIVDAFMAPCEESTHILSIKITGKELQLVKRLAADLGCSQENTLRYCLKETLKARGIKSEQSKSEKSDLWFLHPSK